MGYHPDSRGTDSLQEDSRGKTETSHPEDMEVKRGTQTTHNPSTLIVTSSAFTRSFKSNQFLFNEIRAGTEVIETCSGGSGRNYLDQQRLKEDNDRA
jgi:hypothetical protein